jgi:hypothetical protein
MRDGLVPPSAHTRRTNEGAAAGGRQRVERSGGEKKLSPEALPGGGEVSASGLMFWIARAGGQKVTIRTA